MNDEGSLDEWSESQRLSMIDFFKGVLHYGSQPREDYFELIQLSLVYLGGYDLDLPRFRAPKAYHQARWMAKAIYVLKIALFSQQLELTRSETEGVPRLARFVSLIYVRFWHEASISTFAPKNDLEFLHILQVYGQRGCNESTKKTLMVPL